MTSCAITEYIPSFSHLVGSIGILAALKALSALYQSLRATPKPCSLLKLDWKKDRVYLFQFPRSKYGPNLSPFCLKVETFLALHGIDYEVIPSLTNRSKNERVPFIELNGEQIADSQFIIEHLKQHFGIEESDPTGGVRAFTRLADDSLFYAISLERALKNPRVTFHPNSIGIGKNYPEWLHPVLAWLAARSVSARVRNRITTAFGNLSDDELLTCLRADLAAFSKQLGSQSFLFGGDKPTTADVALFAHLGCAIDIPVPQLMVRLVREDFANLGAHFDRIKRLAFPNWPRAEADGQTDN